MLVEEDDNDDYFDDPITLYHEDKVDIRWYSDDVIVLDDDDSEINTVDTNLFINQVRFDKYVSTCHKKVSLLPQSFSRIEKNIELLNECRPLKISVVDCKRFPWYYRRSFSSVQTDEDDIIIIDNILNLPIKNQNCDENKSFIEKTTTSSAIEQDKNDFEKHNTNCKLKKITEITGTKIPTYNLDEINVDEKKRLSSIDSEKFNLYANIIEKAFDGLKYKKNSPSQKCISTNKEIDHKNKVPEYTCQVKFSATSNKTFERYIGDKAGKIRILNKQKRRPNKNTSNVKICKKKSAKITTDSAKINVDNNNQLHDFVTHKSIENNLNLPCEQLNSTTRNNLTVSLIGRNCNLYPPCTKQLKNARKIIPHFHGVSTSVNNTISNIVGYYARKKKETPTTINNQPMATIQTNECKTRTIKKQLKKITNYRKLFNQTLNFDYNQHNSSKINNCTKNSATMGDLDFIPSNPYSTFIDSSFVQLLAGASQAKTSPLENNLVTQNSVITNHNEGDTSYGYNHVLLARDQNENLNNPNISINNNTIDNYYNTATNITHEINYNLQNYYNEFALSQRNPVNNYPIMRNILNTPFSYPPYNKNNQIFNSNYLDACKKCLQSDVQNKAAATLLPPNSRKLNTKRLTSPTTTDCLLKKQGEKSPSIKEYAYEVFQNIPQQIPLSAHGQPTSKSVIPINTHSFDSMPMYADQTTVWHTINNQLYERNMPNQPLLPQTYLSNCQYPSFYTHPMTPTVTCNEYNAYYMATHKPVENIQTIPFNNEPSYDLNQIQTGIIPKITYEHETTIRPSTFMHQNAYSQNTNSCEPSNFSLTSDQPYNNTIPLVPTSLYREPKHSLVSPVSVASYDLSRCRVSRTLTSIPSYDQIKKRPIPSIIPSTTYTQPTTNIFTTTPEKSCRQAGIHKSANLTLNTSSQFTDSEACHRTLVSTYRWPVKSCLPISTSISTYVSSQGTLSNSLKSISIHSKLCQGKAPCTLPTTTDEQPIGIHTSTVLPQNTFTSLVTSSNSLSGTESISISPTRCTQTLKESSPDVSRKPTCNSNPITGYSPPILPISSYQETLKVLNQINSNLDYEIAIMDKQNTKELNLLKRKKSDNINNVVKRISLKEYKNRPSN